jgi:hypothetical protein
MVMREYLGKIGWQSMKVTRAINSKAVDKNDEFLVVRRLDKEPHSVIESHNHRPEYACLVLNNHEIKNNRSPDYFIVNVKNIEYVN